MSDTRTFYETVAPDYHLFYQDWWATVAREEGYLAPVLKANGVQTVLDASAGPGTQSIALARQGFTVTSADLSGGLLERARDNAQTAGVSLTIVESGYADLPERVAGPFDAVITAGNSLPHIISDADILAALHNFYALLKPGGLLLVGIRDFDALLAEPRRFWARQIHDIDGERVIGFDVWDYHDTDPPTITFNNYQVRGADQTWTTTSQPVVYRALRRAELVELMRQAGFGVPYRIEHLWELLLVAHRPG